VRIVVVTATEEERDAVLGQRWPVHGAKLAPYADTRVADCGAGTVVAVPAGEGLAAAVTAAAVAANRAKPDLLVYAALGADGGSTAEGAAVAYAAQRHGVRSVEVRAATLDGLHDAVAPLLGPPEV
jgi:hypothetical protein